MKTATSIAALTLGLALAGQAVVAQTAPAADPAQAGAGAAAATSGGGDAAAAAPAPAAEPPAAAAEGAAALPNGMDLTPDHMENGRWYNAEGIPVPKVEEDGTLDFASFDGYRRYHAECHVCHGPDGEGSTYAPALKESVKKLDYYAYQEVVASGRQVVNAAANQVMPALGTNRNVWCYVDSIYTYLLAHGTGMIERGRPAKKAPKPEEYAAQESACLDG